MEQTKIFRAKKFQVFERDTLVGNRDVKNNIKVGNRDARNSTNVGNQGAKKNTLAGNRGEMSNFYDGKSGVRTNTEGGSRDANQIGSGRNKLFYTNILDQNGLTH